MLHISYKRLRQLKERFEEGDAEGEEAAAGEAAGKLKRNLMLKPKKRKRKSEHFGGFELNVELQIKYSLVQGLGQAQPAQSNVLDFNENLKFWTLERFFLSKTKKSKSKMFSHFLPEN